MTPAPDTGRTAEEMATYVLIKRGLYWRPNAMGYTGVLAEAGLYTEADAHARADGDGTTMQLASEATEFAPACWQETKIAVLSQQVAHLCAENANLRDRVREAEKGGAVERAVTDSLSRHPTITESLRKAEAMAATDPGRAAYQARFAHARPRDVEPWDSLRPEVKAIWARVEAACRAPASLSAQEG